jgi:hypothetical protein
MKLIQVIIYLSFAIFFILVEPLLASNQNTPFIDDVNLPSNFWSTYSFIFDENKKPAIIYFTVDTDEPFMKITIDKEVADLKNTCNLNYRANWIIIIGSRVGTQIKKGEKITFEVCKNGNLQNVEVETKLQDEINNILKDRTSQPLYKNIISVPLADYSISELILTEILNNVFDKNSYNMFFQIKGHGSATHALLLPSMKIISAKTDEQIQIISRLTKDTNIDFLNLLKTSNIGEGHLQSLFNLINGQHGALSYNYSNVLIQQDLGLARDPDLSIYIDPKATQAEQFYGITNIELKELFYKLSGTAYASLDKIAFVFHEACNLPFRSDISQIKNDFPAGTYYRATGQLGYHNINWKDLAKYFQNGHDLFYHLQVTVAAIANHYPEKSPSLNSSRLLRLERCTKEDFKQIIQDQKKIFNIEFGNKFIATILSEQREDLLALLLAAYPNYFEYLSSQEKLIDHILPSIWFEPCDARVYSMTTLNILKTILTSAKLKMTGLNQNQTDKYFKLEESPLFSLLTFVKKDYCNEQIQTGEWINRLKFREAELVFKNNLITTYLFTAVEDSSINQFKNAISRYACEKDDILYLQLLANNIAIDSSHCSSDYLNQKKKVFLHSIADYAFNPLEYCISEGTFDTCDQIVRGFMEILLSEKPSSDATQSKQVLFYKWQSTFRQLAEAWLADRTIFLENKDGGINRLHLNSFFVFYRYQTNMASIFEMLANEEEKLPKFDIELINFNYDSAILKTNKDDLQPLTTFLVNLELNKAQKWYSDFLPAMAYKAYGLAGDFALPTPLFLKIFNGIINLRLNNNPISVDAYLALLEKLHRAAPDMNFNLVFKMQLAKAQRYESRVYNNYKINYHQSKNFPFFKLNEIKKDTFLNTIIANTEKYGFNTVQSILGRFPWQADPNSNGRGQDIFLTLPVDAELIFDHFNDLEFLYNYEKLDLLKIYKILLRAMENADYKLFQNNWMKLNNILLTSNNSDEALHEVFRGLVIRYTYLRFYMPKFSSQGPNQSNLIAAIKLLYKHFKYLPFESVFILLAEGNFNSANQLLADFAIISKNFEGIDLNGIYQNAPMIPNYREDRRNAPVGRLICDGLNYFIDKSNFSERWQLAVTEVEKIQKIDARLFMSNACEGEGFPLFGIYKGYNLTGTAELNFEMYKKNKLKISQSDLDVSYADNFANNHSMSAVINDNRVNIFYFAGLDKLKPFNNYKPQNMTWTDFFLKHASLPANSPKPLEFHWMENFYWPNGFTQNNNNNFTLLGVGSVSDFLKFGPDFLGWTNFLKLYHFNLIDAKLDKNGKLTLDKLTEGHNKLYYWL